MDKWFYAFIFTFLILIGGTLNVVVMDANDCKMPVTSEYPERYPTACYYSVESPQDANLGYLADIIKFRTNKAIHYFSIGDILAISGGLCLTYILVLIAIQHNKTKKREKNIKTN
jgi:hypothetical protein